MPSKWQVYASEWPDIELYRVGRKRWWGIKWLRVDGVVCECFSLQEARNQAARINGKDTCRQRWERARRGPWKVM